MGITQVFPCIPGGVQDYVHALTTVAGDWPTAPLDRDESRSISLRGDLLLHYSGYGFAKRGAPLWLLKKIRAERSQFRTLGVFFHETYAFAPPWRSSFWLSPVQRHIAAELAHLCDYWLTSTSSYASWLCGHAGKKPHGLIPIASTVGEPHSLPSDRKKKIVIFGGASLREKTYRRAGERLIVWAKNHQLELHDIGVQAGVQAVAGSTIHGVLCSKEVSRHLAEAMFAVLAYPPDLLAKSSVFAALCAHGVCSIVLGSGDSASSGLKPYLHYLPEIPLSYADWALFQSISHEARMWYQSHDTFAHLRLIKLLMSQSSSEVTP